MRQFNWQAFFNDGSKISQFSLTGEEILFKCIQDQEKKGNLVRFHLIHKPDNPIKKTIGVGVDLLTGSFLSNFLFDGNFHRSMPDLPFKTQYRLIYYRRMQADATVGASRPQVLNQSLHRYLIGWQATINGKNYQRILFLNPVTLDFEIKEKR